LIDVSLISSQNTPGGMGTVTRYLPEYRLHRYWIYSHDLLHIHRKFLRAHCMHPDTLSCYHLPHRTCSSSAALLTASLRRFSGVLRRMLFPFSHLAIASRLTIFGPSIFSI
jgi:hypothetical protein